LNRQRSGSKEGVGDGLLVFCRLLSASLIAVLDPFYCGVVPPLLIARYNVTVTRYLYKISVYQCYKTPGDGVQPVSFVGDVEQSR
jgi:hypothetical protein